MRHYSFILSFKNNIQNSYFSYENISIFSCFLLYKVPFFTVKFKGAVFSNYVENTLF